MLVTLIAFVALFIIVTVAAVILYVKFEDQKTAAENAQKQLNEVVSTSELQKIGALVGTKQARETYLGKTLDYLDQTIALITPGPAADTSAEVKVDTAKRKFTDTLAQLSPEQLAAAAAAPTNHLVDLLAKEQFATVVESFDPNMKTALPADKLSQAWKGVTQQAGPFKRQMGSRTEKALQLNVTLVTSEFEKGPLDVKLVYNDQNQVAGLWFVPTPEDVLKTYQPKPQGDSVKTAVDIGPIDPNSIGLVTIVQKLKALLDETANAKLAALQQLDDLRKRFDDAQSISAEERKTLLAEKEKFEQQVTKVQSDYNELRALLEKKADEQVKDLMAKLDQEKATKEQTNKDLLKTQAELNAAQDRIQHILKENVWTVKPPPDAEAAAFVPDGKVILVDSQSKIVQLNVGSDDRVYRGLTFSVYEKHLPIPKDGKGKAEVEIFNVEKNVSSARIIRSETKNPIVVDDVIANLIWDSAKTNTFVIAGDFDLNGDGLLDSDAVDKIRSLILKWGGKVADTVAIDTDFVVLGTAPDVPKKPTADELETYPDAMDKYQRTVAKLDNYNQVQGQAQALSIPILNAERFLYFIGYKTQAAKPGAF
jgi:hypothetical protein